MFNAAGIVAAKLELEPSIDGARSLHCNSTEGRKVRPIFQFLDYQRLCINHADAVGQPCMNIALEIPLRKNLNLYFGGVGYKKLVSPSRGTEEDRFLSVSRRSGRITFIILATAPASAGGAHHYQRDGK